MQPSLCQRQQLTGAQNVADKQRAAVEARAQAVPDIRAQFMNAVAADVSPLKSFPAAATTRSKQ